MIKWSRFNFFAVNWTVFFCLEIPALVRGYRLKFFDKLMLIFLLELLTEAESSPCFLDHSGRLRKYDKDD